MKNKKRAMSVLDTQQSAIKDMLETAHKLQSIRQDMSELLDSVFPPSQHEGYDDYLEEAMDFVQLGVVDDLLLALEWRAGWDNSAIDSRDDFFSGLECPFELSCERQQEEPYVLDELISEAPDEMDKPATEKELREFFSSTREMLKEDTDE
jgi:hypothetical protein